MLTRSVSGRDRQSFLSRDVKPSYGRMRKIIDGLVVSGRSRISNASDSDNETELARYAGDRDETGDSDMCSSFEGGVTYAAVNGWF